MTTSLFVYGTLKPGQVRWPALAPFCGASAAGWAAGLLFDSGYCWPAAVFDPEATARVPGFVVSLRPDSLDEALATLDDIEGVAGGLFERIVIEVDDQPCWAYHWPGSTAGFRRIAQWPLEVQR